MRYALRRGLAAAAAVLLGCSEFGHVIPDAMVIRDDGGVVVHASGTTVTGTLEVPSGDSSPLLSVRFLDAAGNEIDGGAAYQLEVTTMDPGLATWMADAPGAFSGRVAGTSAGSTVLLFRWMHGETGLHKDREWPVTVTVSP
jgi:hypothetical protein